MNSLEIPQRLYDSEINFQISCFWDGGFDWKLGDEMNGFKESGTVSTYESALEQLLSAARRVYPNAEIWKGLGVSMDKRYWVEELVAAGPDDGEWQQTVTYDTKDAAVYNAKLLIKPTEHGESGVRVYDTVEGKTVWTNCYL